MDSWYLIGSKLGAWYEYFRHVYSLLLIKQVLLCHNNAIVNLFPAKLWLWSLVQGQIQGAQTPFQTANHWFSTIISMIFSHYLHFFAFSFWKKFGFTPVVQYRTISEQFFVWRIFAKSHCQSEVLIKFKANLTSHFHHASQSMHTALVRWLTTSHCGWSRARTAMSVSLKLRCVTSCWLESVRDDFHIYCLMIWYLWFHQESYKGNLPSTPFCRHPWRGVIVPWICLFLTSANNFFLNLPFSGEAISCLFLSYCAANMQQC